MPKTRNKCQKDYRELYLAGKTRKPHSHTRTLRRSLDDKGTSISGVCAQCDPVLSRHVSEFKGMVHQGIELNRRRA